MPGYIHTHFATGASAAAFTAKPAADAEVQPYNESRTALLLGLQANISALATVATAQTLFNVQITQEPNYVFAGTAATAAIPVTDQNDGEVATGVPREVNWTRVNKIVRQDQDFVFMMNGPGSDEGMIAAHVAYLNGAQPPGWPEGKLIFIKKEDAADSGEDTWDEISTSPVNDLDPDKMYALVGLAPFVEDAAMGAARVSAPSFGGLYPGAVNGAGYGMTYFRDGFGNPCVAGVFSGSESLSVYVYNFAAQKCGVIIALIEIGSTAAVGSFSGGSTLVPGGGGGGPAILPSPRGYSPSTGAKRGLFGNLFG